MPDESKVHPDTDENGLNRSITNSISFVNKKYLSIQNIALYIGAGLSFFDMGFDLIMIREFTNTGQGGFANATAVTVALSISCQLLVAYGNNIKRGKRVVLREMLYVIMLVKPGVDIFRVVSKQKQAANSAFNPHLEMLATKMIELFAECIPGAIIQVMAFVSGQQSTLAIMSLASSIFTAAFIAASIAIEKDVDKECRRLSPDVYGFVPLESRWRTVCVCLIIFMLCAVQLTAKAFACALCAIESNAILAIYLVGDIFVMFAIKLTRCDFTYWPPTDSSWLRNLVSFIARVITKVIVDFTGSPLYRHPYEMGGFYYSFTLISTPFVCFYFGSRYLAHVEDEEVQASLPSIFSSEQVYGSIGALSVLQLISFISLLKIMPKKYRSTFYSLKTGSRYCCELFQKTREDSCKIHIFGNCKSYWEPVQSEVRVWLNDRLPTWINESPEWFDDQIKSTIPDELLDNPSILKKIRGAEVEKIRERRKSSIMQLR